MKRNQQRIMERQRLEEKGQIMLDGNTNDDERAGIHEQYAAAVGSSNLRVGNDSSIRTPGDLIAAAGMNKHRTGLALRRLLTEWDKSAIPHPPTPALIESIAATLEIEPDDCEEKGLVWDRQKRVYRKPREIAEETAARWYANELRLLALSLKRLPEVRDALVYLYGDSHVVSKVLEWWLSKPNCRDCGGRCERLIAGTNHLSGKPCKKCRGTGKEDPPHGQQGQYIANHIHGCLAASARDLREGGAAWKRSESSDADRDVTAGHEKRQQFDRHRSAEVTAKEREVIAEHFRMGKRKLTP